MIISQIIVYDENNRKIMVCTGNQNVFNQHIHLFKRKITSAGHFCNKQGETLIINTSESYLDEIEKSIKVFFSSMLIRKFD